VRLEEHGSKDRRDVRECPELGGVSGAQDHLLDLRTRLRFNKCRVLLEVGYCWQVCVDVGLNPGVPLPGQGVEMLYFGIEGGVLAVCG
jgi:hypothetical protein